MNINDFPKIQPYKYLLSWRDKWWTKSPPSFFSITHQISFPQQGSTQWKQPGSNLFYLAHALSSVLALDDVAISCWMMKQHHLSRLKREYWFFIATKITRRKGEIQASEVSVPWKNIPALTSDLTTSDSTAAFSFSHDKIKHETVKCSRNKATCIKRSPQNEDLDEDSHVPPLGTLKAVQN